jgi:RNA polymerase sigma-70 factor (ECF subfamily)
VTLSDEAIVDRVRHGERHLFEVLMRRNNQRVYRVARSILRDEREVEDVMQESYVRAFAHLNQFEGRARFSTWLTKIALHEALSRARQQNRYVQFDDVMEEDCSRIEGIGSGEPRTPEEDASNRELGEVLTDAIETLQETLRLVFVLRDVEGMTTEEVSDYLGISQENVKVRLHRARLSLRGNIDRRLGAETRRLYSFHLARCDRIVTNVFSRIDRLESFSQG